MKRKIYETLIEWKNSKFRCPLLLVGARQVGKTYIINKFGYNEYKNVVFCNLEKQETIRKVFDGDLDPVIIIAKLQRIFETIINPNDTLIVFDEIQACPKALTSLKYFNEEHNEYHIIASGSLLGVALNRGEYSFPVGKVKTVQLYPMDFEEFLLANHEEDLINKIKTSYETNKPLDSFFHEIALKYYSNYLLVGGMPQAVELFVQFGFNQMIKDKQNEIIWNYLSDMSKYNSSVNTDKSRLIFKNVSRQLAKENKKFKYSILKTGARASEYEFALNWLCTAGLTTKLFRLEQIKLPLNAYSSISDFKLYLNDVGLLNALFNVEINEINSKSNVLNEFKGGMVENYVFNELKIKNLELYYWTSESTAEVDFITKINSEIIPIETKSNIHNKAKSLNLYISKYKPKYSIRISTRNFGFENNIRSIPLYAIFCLTKL